MACVGRMIAVKTIAAIHSLLPAEMPGGHFLYTGAEIVEEFLRKTMMVATQKHAENNLAKKYVWCIMILDIIQNRRNRGASSVSLFRNDG